MKLLKRIRSSIVGRYRHWTFRPYVITRQFAGEEIQVYLGDLFGEGWYGPHHDKWPELDWIRANGVRLGDVVVDCGANHGVSSVLFAKWAGPQGKVFAYEPSPHNMEILRENVHLNAISTIVERPVAVGAGAGTVNITTHPNASVIRYGSPVRRCFKVPIASLDDDFARDSVNFLKIDVEGFELEVLKGAMHILEASPRLALELHVCMYRDKVQELTNIFSLLSLDRYTVDIQHQVDGPITPFDSSLDSPEALASCEVVHLFCR